MPYEAYIGYLTDASQNTRREVENGEPFVIELRDLDTFERLIVRAIVAKPPATVESGDVLWVLDWVESRAPTPWSVRVLEELDEEQLEGSRSDITEADRTSAAEESLKYGGRKYRGSELPDSMGGEEAKKYYENMVTKRKGG
jgi:hypothetical protein